MKSNFLQLQKHHSSLFRVAYSAEELFVNENYCYVPVALRLFAEGIMQGCVIDQDSNTDLYGLISQFRNENPSDRHVSSDATELRLAGNKGSHFEPSEFRKNEIVKLFKAAIRLQNYYLIKELKLPCKATRFEIENLPDSRLSNYKDEELSELYTQYQSDSNLVDKVREYEKEVAVLKGEIEAFEKQLVNANRVSELRLKEKEELAKKLKEVRKDRDSKLNDLQNEFRKTHDSNLKNEIEKVSIAFGEKIEKLNYDIDSLTQKTAQLEQEKQVFERKIIESKTAEKRKTPARDELIKEIQYVESKSTKDRIEDIVRLDDCQNKLKAITRGKHFVIAPPGAGKTSILTHRLECALETYEDKEIICLTFTTKAAQEMQIRAAAILNSRQPFIGNFHRLCLDLLRNNENIPISKRLSSILPDDVRNEFFEMATDKSVAEHGKVYDVVLPESISILMGTYTDNVVDETRQKKATRFDRYSFYKVYPYLLLVESGCNPINEFAIEHLKQPLLEIIIACHKRMYGSNQVIDVIQGAKYVWKIFCKFNEIKSKFNSVDYDEILSLGLLTLIESSEIKKFVQVDEVQDLNPIQWKIIDSLVDEKSHLFIVGDKEQSIYGFLGANINGLELETSSFTKHFLSRNYRSDKPIISLLNDYRNKVWGLDAVEAAVNRGHETSTILINYQTHLDEITGIKLALRKILKSKKRSVAVLFPTNLAADSFCNTLSDDGLRFFRVSSNDLMQQDIIQDWFRLIKAHKGTAQGVDWYNLICRFTSHASQAKNWNSRALNFVSSLIEQCVSLNDVTCDSPDKLLNFQYRIKELIEAWEERDVVIFDTETTGVDFDTSKIIQIAAIRVRAGQVLEVFDHYVDIKLEQADESLVQAYEQSFEIHKITREQISSGESELAVLTKFFDFVGESPLIAHNINFDNTMLRMGVMGIDNYELQERFHEITATAQFDTLLMSKAILPNEVSYKLEHLLLKYNLDGINSHNALDDVKATSSLLTLLIDKTKPNLEKIDKLLDENLSMMRDFTVNFERVNSLIRSYYSNGSKVNLSDILLDWLDFAKAQDYWYPNVTKELILDIKNKLVGWLNENKYSGHIHELFNERDDKTQVLLTLKESDLINPAKDKLIVSTIHKAKGLEFDTVIIPQVTNHHFPGWAGKNPTEQEKQKNYDEKLRLLYVAMSRPVNKLIMSYHIKGLQGGREYNTTLFEPIANCKASFQFTR
ncbi:UvrD-helicase domain-containing protein [Aliikangiella sp. IMCC44632]